MKLGFSGHKITSGLMSSVVEAAATIFGMVGSAIGKRSRVTAFAPRVSSIISILLISNYR